MADFAKWDSTTNDLIALHAEAHRAILVAGAPRVDNAVVRAVAKELMRAGTIERSTVVAILHARDPILKALKAMRPRAKAAKRRAKA